MGESERKIVTVGKNGQISIGKEYAGKTLEIVYFHDGRAVISPGRFVPDHQLSFFTPEAMDQLGRFAAWESENAPAETSTAELKEQREALSRKKPRAGVKVG